MTILARIFFISIKNINFYSNSKFDLMRNFQIARVRFGTPIKIDASYWDKKKFSPVLSLKVKLMFFFKLAQKNMFEFNFWMVESNLSRIYK